MTQEQFNALIAYIDYRIDEKIQDSFGRDSLIETKHCNEAFQELKDAFVFE